MRLSFIWPFTETTVCCGYLKIGFNQINVSTKKCPPPPPFLCFPSIGWLLPDSVSTDQPPPDSLLTHHWAGTGPLHFWYLPALRQRRTEILHIAKQKRADRRWPVQPHPQPELPGRDHDLHGLCNHVHALASIPRTQHLGLWIFHSEYVLQRQITCTLSAICGIQTKICITVSKILLNHKRKI